MQHQLRVLEDLVDPLVMHQFLQTYLDGQYLLNLRQAASARHFSRLTFIIFMSSLVILVPACRITAIN